MRWFHSQISFHEVVPQPGLSEAISILQRLREQDGTRADDGQFVACPILEDKIIPGSQLC